MGDQDGQPFLYNSLVPECRRTYLAVVNTPCPCRAEGGKSNLWCVVTCQGGTALNCLLRWKWPVADNGNCFSNENRRQTLHFSCLLQLNKGEGEHLSCCLKKKNGKRSLKGLGWRLCSWLRCSTSLSVTYMQDFSGILPSGKPRGLFPSSRCGSWPLLYLFSLMCSIWRNKKQDKLKM